MIFAALLLFAVLALSTAILASSLHSPASTGVGSGNLGAVDRDLPLISFLAVLTLVLLGFVLRSIWAEAYPDASTPYGSAYERCVAEDGLSRWHVEAVRSCIEHRLH